jgi:hypothetical protein
MEETNQQHGVGDTNPNGGAEGKKQDDFVSREAYERAIDEVKTFKAKYREESAKNNEFESQRKQAEEQKLLEEKKYLELIENLKREKEQLTGTNQQFQTERENFRKMNAVLSSLQERGINIESKYYDYLPIDKISFDDDGMIDGSTLSSAVDGFVKEHPRLVLPTARLLPNNKTESNGGAQVSFDEWKKMGPKERQKAYADKRVKF